jgi:hypothetical protein
MMMSEGRQKALWGAASHVLAGIANLERCIVLIGVGVGALKGKIPPAFKPSDFDPFAKKTTQEESKAPKVTMRQLAGILGEAGMDARSRKRRMVIPDRPETPADVVETDEPPEEPILCRQTRGIRKTEESTKVREPDASS